MERPVVRWYAQRQLVLGKIATLETELARIVAQNTEEATTEEEAATQAALAKAREELHALGPCPRPMMG